MIPLLKLCRALFVDQPEKSNAELADLIMVRHEEYRRTSPAWLRNTIGNYRVKWRREQRLTALR